MEWIELKLRLHNGLAICTIGKRRGLALLWRQDDVLKIMNFCKHHVHAKISYDLNHQPWFLTGFYSNQETNKRHESWKLLAKIGEDTGKLWCIVGDFNKITSQDEKYVGRLRLDKQMRDFKLALETNSLFDLGWK